MFTGAFNHSWQLSKILSIEQTQCDCSSTNPDWTEWSHYGFIAYEWRKKLLIIFSKVTLSRCKECDSHICHMPTSLFCSEMPRNRRITDLSLFFFSKPLLLFSFRPYVLCFLYIHRIHLAWVETKSQLPPTFAHTSGGVWGWKEQLNTLSSGLILFTQMHSLQTLLNLT